MDLQSEIKEANVQAGFLSGWENVSQKINTTTTE